MYPKTAPNSIPELLSRRDFRIDFFRGLALLIIFIDHIDYNWMKHVTLGFFWFTDAAPMFFFLSGYVACMVYGRDYQKHGLKSMQRKIVRRCITLYVYNWVTFLFCGLALAAFLDRFAMPPGSHQFALLLQDPMQAMVRFAVFSYLPEFFFILPMYIFFLLLLPRFMVWVDRDWRKPAAVVALGYLTAQILQISGFPLFPQAFGFFEGSWPFHPLAWQAVFFGGVLVAHGLRSGKFQIKIGKREAWVAVGILVAIFLFKWHDFLLKPWGWYWFDIPLIKVLCNKDYFSPLVALNFVALLGAAHYFLPRRLFERPRLWIKPIVGSGSKSLQIFCLGIAGDYLINFTTFALQPPDWFQEVASLTGCAILLFLGYYLTKVKTT